jgi:hypothetical protein
VSTLRCVVGTLTPETSYSLDLVDAALTAGIDDLREKREEITKQLREDEAEKAKIQSEVGRH